MQNLGGKGRSSKSNLAEVDGCVNGSGTEPPKSAVEHDATSRAEVAPIAINIDFMVPASSMGASPCQIELKI